MAFQPIRIMIVDDQEMIQQGLETLFEVYDDIEVVGVAANRHDAIRLAVELQPDVILMDLMLSGLPHGIAAAHAIHELLPHLPIIALSAFFSSELIEEARQAGISRYLAKTGSGDDIAAAIRAAHRVKPTTISPEAGIVFDEANPHYPDMTAL